MQTPQPQIDKRDHLINEAIELFAEKGFEGTSIRDLATRAGVNIAMVNYYFGSKEKLFEAIVAKKATHMRGVLDMILADKALSEIEKLDAIIESYIARFFAYHTFHRVLQQELLVSSRDHMHETIIDLFVRNTRDVVGIIQKGIKSGKFKKVDPELTFASIIGTLNQVLSSGLMCNKLMNKPKNYNPYDNPQFKKRLTTHIKCMVHALLLK